jgi:hypothetical protein
MCLKVFGYVSGQGAVGTIEQDARLALDQQAQFGQLVLENGDARHQSMHKASSTGEEEISVLVLGTRYSVLGS